MHSPHSELCPRFTCCPQTTSLRLPAVPSGATSTPCLHSMSSHPAPRAPCAHPPQVPPQPWPLPQRQVFIPHRLPPRGWPRGCREAAALSSLSPSQGLDLAVDFLFLGRWRRQEGRGGQDGSLPLQANSLSEDLPHVLLEPRLSLQLQEGDGPSQEDTGRVEWAGVLSMCGRGLAPGAFL